MKVGVFVNPDEDTVMRAIGECGVTLPQFHGEETPEFCAQFGVMNMKAFRVRDADSLLALPNYSTDAYLLDAYSPDAHGGTGAKFNWDLAIEAKTARPPDIPRWRFDAGKCRRRRAQGSTLRRGRFQRGRIHPGKKDSAKVQAFIKAVRTAAPAE